MVKTKEELNALKIEFESLSTKLQELTDDELEIFSSGYTKDCRKNITESLGMSLGEAYTMFRPLIDSVMNNGDDQTIVAAKRLEELLRTGVVDLMYFRAGAYRKDFECLKKYGMEHGFFRVAVKLNDLDLF